MVWPVLVYGLSCGCPGLWSVLWLSWSVVFFSRLMRLDYFRLEEEYRFSTSVCTVCTYRYCTVPLA